MKTIISIFVLALLAINTVSCTPNSISENSQTPQSCCGEDGDILPPPPPEG